MVACHFAVVAGDGKDGVFHLSGFFQCLYHAAYGVVDDFYVAVVLCPQFSPGCFLSHVLTFNPVAEVVFCAGAVKQGVSFWFFDEGGSNGQGIGVVHAVIRSGHWGVWLKCAEYEEPRAVCVFPDESLGVVGDEGAHLVFCRELGSLAR